jgi:hypothetical protein
VLIVAVAGIVPTNVIAGAGAMTNEIALLEVRALGVPESFTLKVTLVVPAADAGGIPAICPAADNVTPFGSVLPDATVHV